MARKRKAVLPISDAPDWPTGIRARTHDGRLTGIDQSEWLLRIVPMSPVADAKSDEEKYQASIPLQATFSELSQLARVTMKRRAIAKSSYREFHLLTINTPQLFRAPRSHPIADQLNTWYGDKIVLRRICGMAVKLKDSVGDGDLRSAVDSVVETFTTGGTVRSDFDKDARAVGAALTRSGLRMPSEEEMMLLDAWWNHGQYSDTPFLPHGEHIHVFQSADTMRVAQSIDPDDCSEWGDRVVGQFAMSMTAVQGLDLEPGSKETVVDEEAEWVSDLLDMNALCVSIRGKVEPAKVTRAELRRNRSKVLDDIREQAAQGVLDRAEQVEKKSQLEAAEAAYASKKAPPSLVECSAVVAFNGIINDINQAGGKSIANLNTMVSRQMRALAETWLCSKHRANPHLKDWPATLVACSGINALSRAGDDTGALVGFSEKDKQPAYLSPVAASNKDALPIAVVPGATGSGKTQAMLWLARQISDMGRPQIIIDPKHQSDHSDAVLNSGGQVSSLDELTSADGIFDPIRFAASPQAAIDMASSMLSAVNPWGPRRSEFETPLARALSIGVLEGASCIGEALMRARGQERVPDEMIDLVFDLANSSPTFRACVGMKPGTEPLRAAPGITLVKVGGAHLDLPEPGSPVDSLPINQRVTLGLIRMMVFGSAMALTGRQGVLHLDEAWTFLGAGRQEIERLGRLARSQEVLPVLYTQRVAEILAAGLRGYISRGLILSIEDEEEARLACELFNLEPTPERLARITAKATIASAGSEGEPNFNSLKPLRDGPGGRVIRGSVALYSDLSGERAVPVEVAIPDFFFQQSSTNPLDIARKRERAAEAERRRLDANGGGA